jgi:hypothetical protein
VGPVPRVASTLSFCDHLGTIGTRTGFTRNDYKIIPGLYCTGAPTQEAPVLITANYKLSFDALRKELSGISAWILAVDTRGINVWCAAGKGTFSAEEVAFQVHSSQLDQIVSHRELILPQLSANGVAGHEIKRLCGFKGRFGPILASMLPEFLKSGTASEKMRSATFSLSERAVLIPLEICILWKQLLVALVLFYVLSGISPKFFSFGLALDRSIVLLTATLISVLMGAAITPLLLPWIPFRQFWLKGALLGGLASVIFLFQANPGLNLAEQIGLFLWITGCSSYLAMNFTGCTPFTSFSGVEKEMRRGLPFQITTAVLALVFWITGPFV